MEWEKKQKRKNKTYFEFVLGREGNLKRKETKK